MSSSPPSRHILLIDGYGFVFRAYHSMPSLTRPDGAPIGAVYGFTTMLMKLLADQKADHVAVILDSGRQNFRHDIYAEYKANRPPAPEDLVPQFPLIRVAAEALNLPVVELVGYEADDIIATYARIAKESGERVTIVSSDKDLMQLVGEGVDMYDPLKNRVIGVAEVQEKFGVGPERVLDVLALMGDSSDNIPGVPGIGPKTAAELINSYGGLDEILARTHEIKQQKRRETLETHRESALLSRQLAALCDTAPVQLTLDELVLRAPDNARLLAFLKEQGFKTLVNRMESHNGAATAVAKPARVVDRPKEQVIIRDLASLDIWVKKIQAAGAVVLKLYSNYLEHTVITETNMPVGLVLSVSESESCYIPIIYDTPEVGSLDLFAAQAPKQEGIAAGQLVAVLQPLFSDPAILKIGYDIKALQVAIHHHLGGIALMPADDIMLISYVLDAGVHNHELSELASLHLGQEGKIVAAMSKAGLSTVVLEQLFPAVMQEAEQLWQLYEKLKARLFAEHLLTVYERLERPLTPVLAAIEISGVKVNQKRLRELSEEFAARLQVLEQAVYTLAGHSFNIGSPKQLGEVLFEEMGIKGAGRTSTGAYSTGAEVLEELALQGHTIADKILEWRQLSKLKSTYADALAKQIAPKTHRIHTCFQMAVTSTGRLSSTNPNLQNIPIRTLEGNKIRSAFVAAPGNKLLSADYSQIELRLLAHMADIGSLKTAFAAGRDIHTATASQMFGIPVEEIDSNTRRKAKAINFGIIYGISAFGLARQLGIDRGEASRYIQAYFKEYPGIEAFMEKIKAFAREHGYVETLYGRRCHVPGINDKNGAKRSFAERAAINAPLQGTAADIIKKAMIILPGALVAAGLQGVMILQVHDELVLEVPEKEVERTAMVVKKTMERAALLDVPLEVDIGVGDNWAEMK